MQIFCISQSDYNLTIWQSWSHIWLAFVAVGSKVVWSTHQYRMASFYMSNWVRTTELEPISRCMLIKLIFTIRISREKNLDKSLIYWLQSWQYFISDCYVIIFWFGSSTLEISLLYVISMWVDATTSRTKSGFFGLNFGQFMS